MARVAVALLLCAVPAGAGAQVVLNVERLQPRDVWGWHTGVEGGIDLSGGNSRRTQIKAGVGTTGFTLSLGRRP